MNKIKVLIEGYAKKIDDGWLASSTVTLIESKGKKIIVDPGCNRGKLIKALSKNDLKPDDIDYVLLTHLHTDHALLAGIFKNAKVLNNIEIYDNDKQTEHNNKIPGINLKIIQTLGHSDDSCSLLVNADGKNYIISGDVFWWMDTEKQKFDAAKPDAAHPSNMKKLIQSRKKILKLADYIIPGHGKIFKVEK